MSTTYHTTQVSSFDSHVLPAYAGLAHAGRAKAALNEAVRSSQYSHSRYPASQSHVRNNPSSGSSQHGSISRHSTRPSTPASAGPAMGSQQPASASRRGSQSIGLSGQIPACISPKGGSISDFAAQMTCLFWFESIEVLRAAEGIRDRLPSAHIPRLTRCAAPFPQFKKWVYSVVSTTQVTENVILLALLFIYRLKTTNPTVKGRSGSEYRLLTVALMLGNKFLDDNTYTNKTWAEVSGISVQEIHVMEVEFLSNMRYSLLATAEQWDQWLVKLACFHEHYERAQKLPSSPIAMPSPSAKAFNSPLPSPTGSFHIGAGVLPSTPTGPTAYSPNTLLPVQAWPGLQNTPALSSPLSANPNGMMARKRVYDDDVTEPPAKRHARQQPSMSQIPMASSVPARTAAGEALRLPVPNLTLNTNTAPMTYSNPAASFAGQQLVSLPPLVPGVRAMATVYNQVSSAVGQLPVPAVSGPPQMPNYGPAGVQSHAAMAYGTPTKRQSPGSLAGYLSSPMADGFPGSAVHTPISHSPSVYLQQRPSPYKPVRHVNTLLYPPPSASLNEYHLTVPPAQMHYQPLGRRNDLRTGIVPEFMGMPMRQMQPGAPSRQYPA